MSGSDLKIGVFVCNCGLNIAGTVDCKAVAEYASKLPDVTYATDNLFSCSDDGQESIKQAIKEHALNRVIVASCTPRTHEPVFRAVLKELGLSPSYLEFVNVREHVASVHMEEPEDALQKAKDLLRAGIARAAKLEDVPRKVVGVKPTALVIGGGIGGLSAAVNLGDEGFQVYLVEKAPSIGGHMAMLDRTYPTDDCSI